jgi:hypothetical protein
VRHGGELVHLGRFATAEEAALCVARSPEGQAAATERAAPLTSEEALAALTGAGGEADRLRVAENGTGYFGVLTAKSGKPSPIRRGCGAVACVWSWATSPLPADGREGGGQAALWSRVRTYAVPHPPHRAATATTHTAVSRPGRTCKRN